MKRENDIEALIAAAVTGTLSAAEAARLLTACRHRPEILRQLQDHLVMERLLRWHGMEGTVPDGFTDEVLARMEGQAVLAPDFTPRVMEQLPADPLPRTAWSLAGMLLMGAAVVTLFAVGERLLPTPEAGRIVAHLTSSEAAPEFENTETFVTGQRLQLKTGLARLQFERGAELILEGPAELEFTGDNGGILHRGSASVHVPESATGFTLLGPDTRVIDVGTRFGMKVSPERPTEVHVMEGLVLTSTTAQPAKRELHQNEAIAIIKGEAQTIAAQPARFVTALPQRKSGPFGYLHWSFDEDAGTEFRNSGPGLEGSTSSAYRRTLQPDAPGPQRASGVFGPGVFLDGEDAFLETDFPGIGGGGARTVAMWMKVPADWTPEHGYALASWGSLQKAGNAWQMSVNPGDHGGAIGHLRVGVHQSYAVGTTDLRDGRWHHLAAVMYEGEKAAIATHVLLYVDGELEPAEIKSTRIIATDVESPNAVKLQLGRNLMTPKGPLSPKQFFRGWLDEVYVAGEALTQAQIRLLMQENRVK